MEKIALLPGGFKPPHAGHYNMAKWLVANTDADSVIIKIGSKERDGITRDISLKLWDLYRKADENSGKLVIVPSEQNSPVRDVYDFIEQEAPEGSTVYLGMGEKDIEDQRFKNIGKFAEPKNIDFKTVLVPPQAGGVSGTEMRGFISNNDKDSFQKYLPDHLNSEQKDEAWSIVSSLEEDFYSPENKTVDFMRSSEYKAGMPDGPKDDISPSYKYHRAGVYGRMYENLQEQYIPENAGCMTFCDPVNFEDPNGFLGEEQLLIIPICLPGYKPEDSGLISSYQFMIGYNSDILQYNPEYSGWANQMPQVFSLSNTIAGGMGSINENNPGVISFAYATGNPTDWSETAVLTYLVFVVTGNGAANFTWNQNAGGTDVNPNMQSYFVAGVTDCFEDGSVSVGVEEEDVCTNFESSMQAVVNSNISINEFCTKCETDSWAPFPEADQYCECCTNDSEEELYSCPEGTINNMGSQFITPGLTINCDPETANTENIDSAPENMWIEICCDSESEGLPPVPNKDKAPLKDKSKKEPIKKPIKKEPLKEQQGGKTLRVYDFDDTLAVTKGANIKVKHEDGSIDTLDPAEFAVYKEQPGDKFDFTEFDSVIKEATPIQHIVDMLKRDVSDASVDKVTILTARLLAYPVKRYIREDLGLDVYVVAVGSSNPLDKATWIEDHILKGYNNIMFIDDSEPNRKAVKALKDTHPNIKLEVYHPNELSEAMYGMMTRAEKRKHKKTLKKIKRGLKKYQKKNRYFEVPKSWRGSLTRKYKRKKRKLNENAQASINGHFIPLEIMDTPDKQVTGMMGRNKLDGGMLFPYDNMDKRIFHTQKCKIPLDIVFINNNNINKIHSNCPPCPKENCPKYSGKADNVLELPGGYCKENNINIGDHIGLNTYEMPEYMFKENINSIKEEETKIVQHDWFPPKTHGDLYKLISTINKRKQLGKIGNTLVQGLLTAIPGADTAKNAFQFIKAAFNRPDDKKTNTWLDQLDIDDKMSAILDNSVEDKFLQLISDVLKNKPPETPLDNDFNMNNEMIAYLKSQYSGRHISGIEENVFTKKWWLKTIKEHLIVEGGAAGHMAHPFNLPNVNSGKDLKDIFNKSAESLQNDPGSVKIDGVNSSIRLIDLDGEKQFVMDRGSKKELDVKGITKDDLLNRFGDGHGMVKIGGEVLDMFNKALPSIKSDLEKLGAYDDPNILFNMEYVSGKTNVQDYESNFIAIHGLNKIETKEVEGKRGPLTKRVSSEISYDKSALQSLLDNLTPTAKEQGFEVYGSVPTEMTKKPNFSSALSTSYTIVSNEGEKTQNLDQWLNELNNIPEKDFIFMDGVKRGAVSKLVYTTLLNGGNIDELFESEEDKQKAIEGFTTYLATEKLGDEILKVLDSPMGSVDNHEGVVIRDENIANVPFKITGKFILGGMGSDF